MKLTRLRQQPNGLPIVEVEKDFLFASMMLVYIERLSDIKVLAKRSSAISDSFEAVFAYKGWRFYMGIPFGGIMIAPQSAETPRALVDELTAHIDAYRTVWPNQLLLAMTRYFFLPFRPDARHFA